MTLKSIQQKLLRMLPITRDISDGSEQVNPYGVPHSIDAMTSGIPKIPGMLADQADRTEQAVADCGGDDFEKLRLIYDYLDEYNKFVATFAVCKAGCSHCCNIDVDVTRVEALYIERSTGKTMHRKRKRSKNHRTPCPMLSSDGKCGIYEHRPFNCRTLHTLDDSSFCATPNVTHAIYGIPQAKPRYGSDCYAQMANVRDALNKNGEVKDIRDYFGK